MQMNVYFPHSTLIVISILSPLFRLTRCFGVGWPRIALRCSFITLPSALPSSFIAGSDLPAFSGAVYLSSSRSGGVLFEGSATRDACGMHKVDRIPSITAPLCTIVHPGAVRCCADIHSSYFSECSSNSSAHSRPSNLFVFPCSAHRPFTLLIRHQCTVLLLHALAASGWSRFFGSSTPFSSHGPTAADPPLFRLDTESDAV